MEAAIGEAQAIDHHNFPRTEPEAAIDGSTILNIAEVRPTGTGQPRTGSGVLHAVIRLPTVRQALVNSLAVRAALLPATGEGEPD